MKKLTIRACATVGKGPKPAVPCIRGCRMVCSNIPDLMVENISYILME